MNLEEWGEIPPPQPPKKSSVELGEKKKGKKKEKYEKIRRDGGIRAISNLEIILFFSGSNLEKVFFAGVNFGDFLHRSKSWKSFFHLAQI